MIPKSRSTPFVSLVTLALLWWQSSVLAGPRPITEIRFSGNETTQNSILRQELTIQEGEPAEPAAIERSRQAIMDLGLFKQVRSELQETPEGVVVTYVVDEKLYILPIPLIDARAEGDYGYGVDLHFDNLFGLNQRLKLGYEVSKEADDEEQEREYSLDYRYPRIVGTALDLGVLLEYREAGVNEKEDYPGVDAEYLLTEQRATLTLNRWIDQTGPSNGWRVGGGITWRQRDYSYEHGPWGLYEDSQAFSLHARVEYVDVHEFQYHREGMAYGWEGEAGAEELGSDHNFDRHLFYWRSYQNLGQEGAKSPSLYTRVQLGLADGSLFGDRAFEIGGGKSLRGYDELDDGNAMLLANVEYHMPLSGYPQLRGVVFTDVGNVYPSINDMDVTDLEAGSGLGLRWRVQTFVDLTLAADVAYGFGSEETKFYASTSATF